MTVTLIIACVLGYLLGTVPFGLLLTKAAGLGDIRKVGSGNIGATNVLRTGKKGLAAITLLLDGGKGAAAALIGTAVLGPEAGMLAAFAAVIGHNFPVWLKFKGGKGVATSLGVMLAVAWPVGLACAATWLVTAFTFRISSLSALVALAMAPVWAWLVTSDANITLLAGLMGTLGIVRHHANIRRLLKGEEPKIGKKKTATDSAPSP